MMASYFLMFRALDAGRQSKYTFLWIEKMANTKQWSRDGIVEKESGTPNHSRILTSLVIS
jgi:hypothetical protein